MSNSAHNVDRDSRTLWICFPESSRAPGAVPHRSILEEPLDTQLSSHTSSIPTSGSKRILIVEDTDTTRRRLAAILGSHGYLVDEAVDGLDALHKTSMNPYDAIVLDLVLPHVSGWQFRETALRHAELRAIPTIILTVQPLREPDRYALRTPFVLRKPFEDATVVAMVKQACATHSPRSATPRPVQTTTQDLFWSRRGEVACAMHAPPSHAPRWREEGWSAVDHVGTRIRYQCQHCAVNKRPISRHGPSGS